MIKSFEKYRLVMESLNEKTFPNQLKKISNILRKDLLSNGDSSFSKSYDINDITFKLNVIYKNGQREPYYSSINIYSLIEDPYSEVPLNIYVTDTSIDFNYLLSIISHEIRHIYDILTASEDYEFNSFLNSMYVSKYKTSIYSEFIHLFYLSLEHELIARNNMLFDQMRWINITDKNKLYDIFKESFVYKSLMDLDNFDYMNFCKSKDYNSLLKFTNEFSKDIKYGVVCNTPDDVINFYKGWCDKFKEKSKEFLVYVDEMIDDIINDIEHNIIHENIDYKTYHEDISYVNMELLEKLIK